VLGLFGLSFEGVSDMFGLQGGRLRG
jgi:hypothetical protein